MTYQTFPFGKYKGEILSNLPTNYITYAIESFDLPVELLFDLKVILALRLNMSDVSDRLDESVLTKSYRKMASKYHPDKGGTKEQFQAIQDFYQTIKSNG